MIPLSDRYSIVLGCAAALLSVHVLYHFLANPIAVSCKDPETLINEQFLPSVVDFKTVPWKRNLLINGSKGNVELPGVWKGDTSFRISRTYNLSDYYFVPIDNFTNMFPDDLVEVRTLTVDGVEVPVHLRLDESEKKSILTAHFYVLGGQPVRNPFTGSLGQIAEHLRNGPSPLTMILLNGKTKLEHMEENREIMINWIREAWIRYDSVCNS